MSTVGFKVRSLRLLSTFAVILFASFGSRTATVEPSSDALRGAPRVMLWAWERPEDMRFIDANKTGVAFLASTVYLVGDDAMARSRMQPLRVKNGSWLMAAVRVEAAEKPSLSEHQREKAADAILQASSLPRVRAIQVDFDAKDSQRDFYRALLRDLRRRLPKGQYLSMTALTSWCIENTWINDLPVDEAVPMLFRLGTGKQATADFLATHREFPSAICKNSVGLSTDEELAPAPGKRVYLFRARPWTAEKALVAIARVKHAND